MELFSPRTFSTDWEVMVLDRLLRFAGTEKLMGLAGQLNDESGLPIKIDYNALEFPLGVNTSFAQFSERVHRVTDRATQLAGEYELDLFPVAAFPTDRFFNASHIHVGTLYDESVGIDLENMLIRDIPAFGALAANSPVWHGRRGEFKSYRLRFQASGCTRPEIVRIPAFSQFSWGSDAAPKIYSAPTFEVRVIDCASSRRLLAEMAVFIAAYVHTCGARVQRGYQPSPQEYLDAMTNRWTAARDGLQATFRRDGRDRPVVEVLAEMLAQCEPALEVLGARTSDLTLIHAMLEKRVCQADLVCELANRYAEPHLFTSAYAKLIRHWDVFDDYLATVPPLTPRPAPDDTEILAIHLALIGEHTPYYKTRESMYFPPPAVDALIATLEAQGRITRNISTLHGCTLSRTAGP